MLSLKSWKIKKLTKRIKALKHSRQSQPAREEALKKEVMYYFELASIYKKLNGHKKYPFAELMVEECYRQAAALDDPMASYLLGMLLLDEGKFRQQLQNEGVLDSSLNERHMKQRYEEAHAYLKAADNLGHIEAKRLLGLCFINGWGMSADKDKGFEMIVESIEKEGSWDKVPQIFAAIGLNKPEFFAAIMKRRHG